MKTRDLIYLGILVFVFIWAIGESVFLANRTTTNISDIVMPIVITVMTALWCEADARLLQGHQLRNWLLALLIVGVPIGLAVHMLMTRRPGQAILMLIGFTAGFFGAGLVGIYAGNALVAILA